MISNDDKRAGVVDPILRSFGTAGLSLIILACGGGNPGVGTIDVKNAGCGQICDEQRKICSSGASPTCESDCETIKLESQCRDKAEAMYTCLLVESESCAEQQERCIDEFSAVLTCVFGG